MMKRKYVYYHRADNDGVLSGYLAGMHYRVDPMPLEYHEVDAIDPVKWQPLVVVDLSMTKKRVKRLAGFTITYVDHHRSSVEALKKPPGSWKIILEPEGNRSTIRLLLEEHGIEGADRFPHIDWIARLISDYDTMTGDIDTAAKFEVALEQVRKDRYPIRWFDFAECRYAADVLSMNRRQILSLIELGGRILPDLIEKLIDSLKEHDGLLWTTSYSRGYMFRKVLERKGVPVAVRIAPDMSTATVYTNGSLAATDIVVPLGGGGHERAAGFPCNWARSPEQVVERIREVIDSVRKGRGKGGEVSAGGGGGAAGGGGHP